MSEDPLQVIGTTIDGKYDVVSLAGQGGFSAVYKATHNVWDEPVAIKFFTSLQEAREELREKLLQEFVQEGKLMSQLSSRSAAIVQARDIGRFSRDDGSWFPFMVLEWIEGTPLDDVLTNEQRAGHSPRSLEDSIRLLEPAAVALDVAHRSNIAHRDLKPANIIVLGDPRSTETQLKLLDFGIAKVMSEHSELQDQLQMTGAQITSFTPNYGAPEQFTRDFGATGPWTDVYAMALILVELVTGTRALTGDTFFEVGSRSCDTTHRPTPSNRGATLPPAVEGVFAKALALRPADRYPTMGAFWGELRRAGLRDESTWLPPSLVDTGPRPSSPGEATAVIDASASVNDRTLAANVATVDPPTGSPGAAASRKGMFAAAAALVILGGVGAGVSFMGDGKANAETESPAAEPAASEVAAAEEPPEAVTDDEDDEKAEDAEEPSDAPAGEESAEATASAAPAETAAKPPPAPVSPRPIARPPPPPPPPPAKKSGKDAWDPNSFGGR